MKLKDAGDRQRGIMYGLAYGDALGRPTEFMKAASIAKLGSPFRSQVGLNHPHQGIVTDDTQMSIAVAKAAIGVTKADPAALATSLVAQFICWQRDPKSMDGRRAPGATCMSAVSALQRNPRQWLLATRPNSKGNGANMRVAPLALRTDWTWEQLAGASQLQAALTHGHPTALAAAELTAVAVRVLLEGFSTPGEALLDHLLAYAYDNRSRYHGDWLGHLWEGSPAPYLPPTVKPKMQWWEDAEIFVSEPLGLGSAWQKATPKPKAAASPREFIERGWDEVIDALLKIYDMPRKMHEDPCDIAGGGWVAEEALANAVHVLLCFPGNPADALRRAAFTDGDSDSIASITGALAGAAYGLKAFPSHWAGNLEYRAELKGLAAELMAASRR